MPFPLRSMAAGSVALLPAGCITTGPHVALLNNRDLRATFEEIGLSQADLFAVSRLLNPGLGVRWPHDALRGPNVDLTLATPRLNLSSRARCIRVSRGTAHTTSRYAMPSCARV